MLGAGQQDLDSRGRVLGGELQVITVNDVTMSRCTWRDGPFVRRYMTVQFTLLDIFYHCTVSPFFFLIIMY